MRSMTLSQFNQLTGGQTRPAGTIIWPSKNKTKSSESTPVPEPGKSIAKSTPVPEPKYAQIAAKQQQRKAEVKPLVSIEPVKQPALEPPPIETWVVSQAWRRWWKSPTHKPIILITDLDALIIQANAACRPIDINADVKLAMVLATFIESEREILSYESISRMTIEHLNSGKVLVIDERVSETEDYDVAVDLYHDYNLPFIILPSEYKPMKLSRPGEYMIYKCRSDCKDWDWYKWITTMEKAGLVNRADGTN